MEAVLVTLNTAIITIDNFITTFHINPQKLQKPMLEKKTWTLNADSPTKRTRMHVIMSTKLIRMNMMMLMVFLGFSQKNIRQKREAGVPMTKQRIESTPNNISTDGIGSAVPFILMYSSKK